MPIPHHADSVVNPPHPEAFFAPSANVVPVDCTRFELFAYFFGCGILGYRLNSRRNAY